MNPSGHPHLLTRRTLLTSAALTLGGCASTAERGRGRPAPAAAAPPRPSAVAPTGASTASSTAPSTARRLEAADIAWLNRLTWGVDAASVAELQQLGRRAWLARQLEPAARPVLPPAVQDVLDRLPSRTQSLAVWRDQIEAQRRASAESADGDPEARRAARQALQQMLRQSGRDAAQQSLLLAVHDTRQLQSQMTWFWFNHFNVFQGKGDLRVLVGDHEDALRPHALGRFEDLLRTAITHQAMLRYLDNDRNAALRGNENLARELMELHTLGVDGGYTQADVQALARVLTGLGPPGPGEAGGLPAPAPLLRPGASGVLRPGRHDRGDKRLLGVDIRGGDWAEILGTLSLLARQPATATHVCRRMATWMVADVPSPALLARMIATFQSTSGHIGRTLATMIEHPDFDASLGRRFKDPMHHVVSAVRLVHDAAPVVETQPMQRWLQRLGQGLFDRSTPDGWPLASQAWEGSSAMALRLDLARSIASAGAALRTPLPPERPAPEDGGAAGVAAPATPPTPARSAPPPDPDRAAATLGPLLGPRSRQALAERGPAVDRLALLLAAPEFMMR